MTYRDKILSLVGFVSANSHGMREIKDLEIAEAVFNLLRREGMEPRQLVDRALFSHHPKNLFRVLAAHVTEREQRDEVIDRLVSLYRQDPDASFDEHTDIHSCLSIFIVQLGDMLHLVDSHRELLYSLDGLSPVLVDTYWIHEFERRLENKDWGRAWDTIKRAHLGFMTERRAEHHDSPINAMLDADNRVHDASTQALRGMITELFACLTGQGKLQAIHFADLTIKDFRTRPDANSHDCSNRRAKWHPGLNIATRFAKNESDGTTPLHLFPEGAMVLRLATYFNQLRREKSRHRAQQLGRVKDALQE